MIKQAFYLVFCTLIFGVVGKLSAQSVKGNWYGIGVVDVPNGGNNYLAEMILNEKNKSVSGTFNYYFRDSLFSNKIEGTYNDVTRKLLLNKQNIIFYKSTNTKIGVDCPMYGELILRVSKVESVLKGVLFSDAEHQFTCPSINVTLKKSFDTASLKPEPIIVQNIDTARVLTPITTDLKQQIFEKRIKTYTQEIAIENDFIKIELYDNGQIDYDSVSIYLNNKLVLPETMLTHNAISIKIPLNKNLPFNELSMFADNVGLIPPNTAALILYDGTIRHEVMMSSDFNKTATIKLVRKQKD